MRTMILSVGVLSLLLSSCVVRHQRHGARTAGGEIEEQERTKHERSKQQTVAERREQERAAQERSHHHDRTPPPPDRTPPPPPREPGTHRAPPAPAQPELSVQLGQASARRGQEITLTIHPFHPNVMVFFNGRPLPKKTEGNHFVVTVPSSASSGHFEVEWQGRRFRSPRLNVTP